MLHIDEMNLIDVEEASVIGEGDIIIRTKAVYRDEAISEMEKKLSKKLDRKVILLDARFGEILVVPPKKCGADGSPEP